MLCYIFLFEFLNYRNIYFYLKLIWNDVNNNVVSILRDELKANRNYN